MRKRNKYLTVLIISPMYPPEGSGGVAIHVQYLTEALNTLNRKCKIHVVTVHNKGGAKPIEEGIAPNLFIHKVQGERNHFRARGNIPYECAIKYCMDICNNQETKPDVIHVHDFHGVHIAGLLKFVYDIPIAFTVHKTPKEWDSSEVYFEPKNFHLHALTKLNIFDMFVAPSKAYKEHLENHGISETNIKILHHGIPGHSLQSMNCASVLDKFNVRNRECKIIFCPIRLDRHKGPDVFIEAAAIVLNNYDKEELHFIIAGGGSDKYKEELILRAEQLGIGNKIEIGPPDNQNIPLEEMATLYRNADICVLPSRREGFGQVILEAFLFKKPIIGSNVGGISEIIIPEENGLLFHRDEPDKLAEQIVRLLKDEPLRERIAQEGYSQFTKKYEASIMAKNYYTFYKNLNQSYKTRKGRP